MHLKKIVWQHWSPCNHAYLNASLCTVHNKIRGFVRLWFISWVNGYWMFIAYFCPCRILLRVLSTFPWSALFIDSSFYAIISGYYVLYTKLGNNRDFQHVRLIEGQRRFVNGKFHCSKFVVEATKSSHSIPQILYIPARFASHCATMSVWICTCVTLWLCDGVSAWLCDCVTVWLWSSHLLVLTHFPVPIQCWHLLI